MQCFASHPSLAARSFRSNRFFGATVLVCYTWPMRFRRALLAHALPTHGRALLAVYLQSSAYVSIRQHPSASLLYARKRAHALPTSWSCRRALLRNENATRPNNVRELKIFLSLFPNIFALFSAGSHSGCQHTRHSCAGCTRSHPAQLRLQPSLSPPRVFF